MKTGDIVLTKNDSQFGRVLSKYGNVYWTHVNMMIDSKYTPDLALTHKDFVHIDDLLDRKDLIDYKVLKSNADSSSIFLLDNFFKTARYESLNGLYRLKRKLEIGRDKEIISTSYDHYQCASLLGRVLEDRLPNNFHYSQFTPDDYNSYFSGI